MVVALWFVSIFSYLDFLEFNFLKVFLISTIIILFETFASSSSMISRGMFLIVLHYYMGFINFQTKLIILTILVII